MTDEQLAAKIEEHAKYGSHAYPPLLYAAAERLYALSAKCALLGACLAQAEREADAVAASEPFGYFRALPMGWEDCAETDDGAIPLYEHPAPVASAAPECSASEVGIQTSEPRAWAHFVKNGNIRIWSSTAKEAVRIAKETGIELTPLYTEPQPDRVAALERELENERMRLAACGTAALGYYDGCADEYRSASLDDVLRLRSEVERLRTALAASCEDERGQLYESGPSAGGCARATAAEAEIERLRGLLSGLVEEVQGLMCESDGVAGLHRNGDVALWSELEAGGPFERLSNLPAGDLIAFAVAVLRFYCVRQAGYRLEREKVIDDLRCERGRLEAEAVQWRAEVRRLQASLAKGETQS